MDYLNRTENLIGHEGLEKLRSSHVAIFGIGGVGGYVAEGLARTGIGTLSLFDNDSVSLTNLNRQIIALRSTIGKSKTEAMEERIHDISPNTAVICHNMFYLPENAADVDLSQYTMVVDAVDTVAAKLNLALECQKKNVKIISAMGAGNKLHPEMLRIADISETTVDPLARVMRRECKKRGIRNLEVAYSTEEPLPGIVPIDEEIPSGSSRRTLPGSCVFVPAVMGMLISSQVVLELLKS